MEPSQLKQWAPVINGQILLCHPELLYWRMLCLYQLKHL